MVTVRCCLVPGWYVVPLEEVTVMDPLPAALALWQVALAHVAPLSGMPSAPVLLSGGLLGKAQTINGMMIRAGISQSISFLILRLAVMVLNSSFRICRSTLLRSRSKHRCTNGRY